MPTLEAPNCRLRWCSFHGSAPLARLGGSRRTFGSPPRIDGLLHVGYTPPTRATSRGASAAERESSAAARAFRAMPVVRGDRALMAVPGLTVQNWRRREAG